MCPASVTRYAAHIANLPWSCSAHAKDIYTSHPEQLKEKMTRAAFVTTCTRHNQKFLEGLGAHETPIHCNYHGIDLGLFTNNVQPSEPVPPYHLFTIARITEKKGLPTVYRALKILADRNMDFHHNLIGDGDDRERILRLIEDLGLSKRCSWLGTRPHGEVLDYFKQSDLFLAMTGGGPGSETETVAFILSKIAFSYFYTGDASALAVILLIIIIVALGAAYWWYASIIGRRSWQGPHHRVAFRQLPPRG